MRNQSRAAALAVLALAAPLGTGCASNQALRASLDERDAEIRDLREERIALKGQIALAESERDGMEVALAEAAATLSEPPEPVVRVDVFPELDAQGISYGVRGDHMVFSIPAAVTFGSGKATLSDKGATALRSVAERLKGEFPASIYHIEGHTDADPIQKSKFASNRDLSLARAMAVLTYLVTECRVKDDQFVVEGLGQYRPVAPNDTKANKARNRRVEIVVHER